MQPFRADITRTTAWHRHVRIVHLATHSTAGSAGSCTQPRPIQSVTDANTHVFPVEPHTIQHQTQAHVQCT